MTTMPRLDAGPGRQVTAVGNQLQLHWELPPVVPGIQRPYEEMIFLCAEPAWK